MAPRATEEQVLYANILNKGMMLGLLGLIVTFAVYALGVLEPRIPLAKVQDYWVMPVNDYLERSGIHAGWAWLGQLSKGDMLNFAPIAFLSGLTIICYLAIVPGLSRWWCLPWRLPEYWAREATEAPSMAMPSGGGALRAAPFSAFSRVKRSLPACYN
jgi:hypothetical protein